MTVFDESNLVCAFFQSENQGNLKRGATPPRRSPPSPPKEEELAKVNGQIEAVEIEIQDIKKEKALAMESEGDTDALLTGLNNYLAGLNNNLAELRKEKNFLMQSKEGR